MITLFAMLSLAGAPYDLGNPKTLFPPAPRPAAWPAEDFTLLGASHCAMGPTLVSHAPPVGFTRLGALPDAHAEIAVNRTVGGCPAPVIVRYNVSK